MTKRIRSPEIEEERKRKIKEYIDNKYSLIGKKFGKLIVESEFIKNQRRYCNCVCECGKKIKVLAQNLRTGHTKSCGCILEKWREKNNRVYKEPLYKIWKAMKSRCYNLKDKRYTNYGGREITICDSWLENYQQFKDWAIEQNYKDGLSIERIDVNKGYNPKNCKWIEIKEQANNKTNTVIIEYNNEKKSLRDFCIQYNLSYKAVYWRIKKGWDLDKVFKTKTPTEYRGTRCQKKRKN